MQYNIVIPVFNWEGNIEQICFNKSIKLISEEGTTNQKKILKQLCNNNN